MSDDADSCADDDDEEMSRSPGLSPIEWFFGSRKNAMRWVWRSRVPWTALEAMGWYGEYVQSAEFKCFPQEPGIYVVANEVDSCTLYVGQSRNLADRIQKDRHRKIRKVIQLYDAAPAGYHNLADPASDIRVLYKTVQEPWPALTLLQTLLWYESLAVGLLCPIAQGNTRRLEEQSIQLGRDFF